MLKSAYQAAVLAALLMMPAVANASLNAGDVIRFLDGPGSPGGEYGVAMAGTSSPVLFKTFCIEKNEFLDFTHDFKIVSITAEARDGGIGGGSPDPISGDTAWLYLQFHNGTLQNYASNPTQANKLQDAIWMLEQEMSIDTSNFYYNLVKGPESTVTKQMKTDALARVRVLNLEWVDGGKAGQKAQDVLYVIPPTDVVPEPTTVVVWSALSCIGLLCYRRSRVSK